MTAQNDRCLPPCLTRLQSALLAVLAALAWWLPAALARCDSNSAYPGVTYCPTGHPCSSDMCGLSPPRATNCHCDCINVCPCFPGYILTCTCWTRDCWPAGGPAGQQPEDQTNASSAQRSTPYRLLARRPTEPVSEEDAHRASPPGTTRRARVPGSRISNPRQRRGQ